MTEVPTMEVTPRLAEMVELAEQYRQAHNDYETKSLTAAEATAEENAARQKADAAYAAYIASCKAFAR